MKNKKLISMVVAIALVAVIGVGATLAYFTDKEEATNVIKMGHVDITLTEPKFDEDTDGTKEITDIEPGKTIEKDPTITVVEGSKDAYVRATVEVKLTDDPKTENKMDEEVLKKELEFDLEDGWFFNETDGYFYYKDSLTAGETKKLFSYVTIPASWGNECADITFEIVVKAEAIQADNFEPERNAEGMIIAWTYNDEPITVENYEEVAASVEADAE